MPRNIAHRRQHAHWYIVHGAWTAGKRRDDHPKEAEAAEADAEAKVEAEAEAEEG